MPINYLKQILSIIISKCLTKMTDQNKNNIPEISIILPCLNEQESIGKCLTQIKQVIQENQLNAELIIVNNGSTDNSCNIIKQYAKGIKGKLIHHPIRGYGSAYLKGFEEAQGKYIFMADPDGTYDFKEIPNFINELRKGYDFVIGDRFKGGMDQDAMPKLHKYIGNPLLSGILRLFFHTKTHDAHCGMRAITKSAFEKLNLQTIGMEFASEMVIKAGKRNLKIKELPINYHKRQGTSKLKSFSDGWRHLRFMLLYCPKFLFFIPGLFLFLMGLFSMIWLTLGHPILNQTFQYHPIFISAIITILGYQLIFFGVFAKTYAITHLKEKPIFNKLYKHITIEKASIAGFLIIIFGIGIYITTFLNWVAGNFDPVIETKKSIIALTLLALGFQSIFSAFMLSILGIKEK